MKIFDVNTCFGFYRFSNRDASLEKLISVLGEWNIAKACTISMKGMFYDYIEGNEETLEVCGKHSSLVPIGTIDPRKCRDVEKDVGEIKDKGFKIVRMFPEWQGWGTGHAVFLKILKALNKCRLPLIINASPGELCNIPEEIDIPIIFVSCHYYSISETLAVFEDRSNFYAESRQLISPDAEELFMEKIGPERLVYGSCAPLEYTGSSLTRISYSSASEEEKELVLGGNLERILKNTKGG